MERLMMTVPNFAPRGVGFRFTEAQVFITATAAKDGVVDTSWGTNGSKTGKTLSVSSADVDTKATFMVVVSL